MCNDLEETKAANKDKRHFLVTWLSFSTDFNNEGKKLVIKKKLNGKKLNSSHKLKLTNTNRSWNEFF